MVEHGRTGLHFRPGDAVDLAAKIEWAWRTRTKWRRCGAKRARSIYVPRMDLFET